MKKITLYTVELNDKKDEPLTVATSVKNCIEYVNAHLMVTNKQHFISWCKIHEKEINTDSWKLYRSTVLGGSKTKYFIKKHIFTVEDIAYFLRILSDCKSLGCSYECTKK